jgi:sigma-B regulation protein RsbU (phosphoserine phosphatase)
MRLSLLHKLSALLFISLACVLVPALVITYRDVGATSLRNDTQLFTATLRLIEENIAAGFIHLNASKVSGVIRSKDVLRLAAGLFASCEVRLREEENPDALHALWLLRNELQTEYAEKGILVTSFSPGAMREAPQTPLGLVPGLRDIKGRTLAEILARLPLSGDFVIFRLPAHGLTLLHFVPSGALVAVSAISMQALENEAESATREMILGIQDRFASLYLHPGGFVALLDAGGNPLAEKGDFEETEPAALAPLLAEARARGGAEAVLHLRSAQGGQEEILAAAGFSRPFGWFTVMAAPLREISAPSQTLLVRLILQSLGIGLLVIVVGMFLLTRTMRPLRMLRQKIRLLPDLDFSSPDAGAALARDLPLDQQDDVGDLARAFAAMGEKLQYNIRAYMEAARTRDRMQGELNAARDIQKGILPPPDLAPNIAGLASHALLEPAREIGGDLYDFFTVPDGRHAFVIGDVSGKGVPAALFMAITVTLARFTLNEGDDPGTAMGRINDLLQARNPGAMFVTLFLILYDPATGRLEYANGGHNPPLLAGGDVSFLEGQSGPMVGVMPGLIYTLFTHDLRAGEMCLLYTDGVTEAVNAAMELYGEERLTRHVRENADLTPQDLLAGIFADIGNFRGDAPPFDDITMLAFARR